MSKNTPINNLVCIIELFNQTIAEANMRSFYTKIVGVTFNNHNGSQRQQLITDMTRHYQRRGFVALHLLRQQNNPHDKNAVAVLDPHGRQLGYLSRQVARTIAPVIDNGGSVSATAVNITGGTPKNFGVNLRLEYSVAA